MARIHRRTVPKKDLHDPDNHDGVITHLEPDFMECEVKWAFEGITMKKASGGDGTPVELFQILKDDALNCGVEKTLESPLDCKEIQSVNPKGNQSRIFIGRTDAEAQVPILWPPDAKN